MEPMYGLDGRIALVTGAASGIGRAIALRYADAASYMTGRAINVTGGLWLQ